MRGVEGQGEAPGGFIQRQPPGAEKPEASDRLFEDQQSAKRAKPVLAIADSRPGIRWHRNAAVQPAHRSFRPIRSRARKRDDIRRNRSRAGGTPDAIRTHNLLIRSQTLYPVELRVRTFPLVRRGSAILAHWKQGLQACRHGGGSDQFRERGMPSWSGTGSMSLRCSSISLRILSTMSGCRSATSYRSEMSFSRW